jgi:hypothetical protein
MQNRRNFLKKSVALVVAVPAVALPNLAFAGEIVGETTLKGVDEKTLRGPGLKRWITEWINREIARSKDAKEAQDYLKKDAKSVNGQIEEIVARIQGTEGKGALDKPQSIKIKFSFEFPPAKFKVEVSF